MPRKPFQMHPEFPYHLVARSNGKDWFAIELPLVWEIMSAYLYFIHHAFGVRIHSFVLMANHFHLIATFPLGNLSDACAYFMRETSRVIAHESNRINHVYGNRIFRSCITSNHYYEHAYKYVYRNPVEAGICEQVENYAFSTLSGLLGKARLMIPVQEDTLLFDRLVEEHLHWLNDRPDEENTHAIRKALKRPTFQLPKQTSSRRRHKLESNRY